MIYVCITVPDDDDDDIDYYKQEVGHLPDAGILFIFCISLDNFFVQQKLYNYIVFC